MINIFLLTAEMKVNFIYTYSVEMDREKEGFFAVTPPEVNIVPIPAQFCVYIAQLCFHMAKYLTFGAHAH